MARVAGHLRKPLLFGLDSLLLKLHLNSARKPHRDMLVSAPGDREIAATPKGRKASDRT